MKVTKALVGVVGLWTATVVVGMTTAVASETDARSCEGILSIRGGRMVTKEEVIKKLDLKPLEGEGGFYRETYRSSIRTAAGNLGILGTGQRSLATAIYYLVGEHDFSALHRLKGDEMFHFYGGDPVEMVQIGLDGRMRKIIMGSDILNGEEVQVLVPAGTWQGTRLREGGQWALMGTTMAPGFEFTDFELGDREMLRSKFPAFSEEIVLFTR